MPAGLRACRRAPRGRALEHAIDVISAKVLNERVRKLTRCCVG